MIVSSVTEREAAFRTETPARMRENTVTIDFAQTFTKYKSRSPSLMAAITEPGVINSCQSQLNLENSETPKDATRSEFCSEPADAEVLK